MVAWFYDKVTLLVSSQDSYILRLLLCRLYADQSIIKVPGPRKLPWLSKPGLNHYYGPAEVRVNLSTKGQMPPTRNSPGQKEGLGLVTWVLCQDLNALKIKEPLDGLLQITEKSLLSFSPG